MGLCGTLKKQKFVSYRVKFVLALHVSLNKLNIMDGFLYFKGKFLSRVVWLESTKPVG